MDGAVALVSKLYGSASDELTKAVASQQEFHAANLRVYKEAREVFASVKTLKGSVGTCLLFCV